MIDPSDIVKRYYKIGEVAKMFGVATSLIRYWESEFPHLKPIKGKNGIRRYQKEDILLIDRIYTLVKEKGFTLEGANNALEKSPEKGTPGKSKQHLAELRKELEKIKSELIELKEQIGKN